MRKFIWTFLACGALAFAQLDSGSITIAASRSITLQPDQVVFSVAVTSGLQGTLDQVVASLQPLGISAANFLGVNTVDPSTLQWNFKLTAPLANIKDTIAALKAADSSLNLAFQLAGAQVSPELQASQQCSIPDLVSDARAQGQKMAAAAGMTLGPVLAVANLPVVYGILIPGSSGLMPGNITSARRFAPLPVYVPPSQPVTCSATIKFALQSL
jgi:hypothetical protein